MTKEIKVDKNVRVVLDSTVGYIIRAQSITGLTVTVGLDGSVSIGASQRFRISPEIWAIITQEVTEGQKFMAKLSVVGVDNYFRKNKNTKSARIKCEKNTIYKDNKDRIIIYLGNGVYTSTYNRSGCNELWGVFKANQVRKVDSNNCALFITLSKDTWFDFDSYVTKPRGLVQVIYEFPETANKVFINDHLVVEYDTH